MKTILLILLASCVGTWAQAPDTNGTDARVELLRRKMREALASETNAASKSETSANSTSPANKAEASATPTNAGGTAAAQSTLPAPPSVTPRRVPPRRIPPLGTNNHAVVTAASTNQNGTNLAAPSVTNLSSTNVAISAPAIPAIPTAPVQPAPTTIDPTVAAAAAALQPTTNIPASAVRAPMATNVAPAEPIIPAGEINFPAVDVNQVLQVYGELVGRTVLRPTALPAQLITLKTQTPLTKSEAIEAFNSVLAMNGITMINVGDKFVKAVPQTQALTAGAAFKDVDPSQLPETGAFVPRIVQLKYAKPSELMQVLQPLSQMPGGILPIDSSQTLIIRDYSENVKRMMELIKQVDVEVPMDYETAVIPIKYALADEIANALGSLGGGSGTSIGRSGRTGTPMAGSSATPGGYSSGTLSSPGGSFGANPGGTSPFGGNTFGGGNRTTSFTDRLNQIVRRASATGDFQILGNNKIIADERTNSLLVFASKQDMTVIKDIVAKLDVVLAQVLIEAVILEVNLNDETDLGVSYLQRNPSNAGDFSGIGAINNNNFLNPTTFTAVGTNGASALPSGFSYLARLGGDLDVSLTAFANNSRINILSRPRIQTSHAVQANLQIGQTVPYVTGTYFGGINGQASSQYQQIFVGINLQVTPLINPDGLVVMDILQDVQQIGGNVTIDGNQVPITTKRTAQAKVSVKDRDTVILGGFITDSKDRTRSGVPFLKDIPGLGVLFRSSSDKNTRQELIVLIRPTVLPTPESAALVATRERDRLPGVKSAEADFRKDDARRLKQADKIKLPEADY